MHLHDVLASTKPSLSIEVFPPKSASGWDRLFERIEAFQSLGPDFVSVTYGAGGSTRQQTRALVARIAAETELLAVPHLTCVCQSTSEIETILSDYRALGITGIMALGGDPPKRAGDGCSSDFAFASELVSLIRESNETLSKASSAGTSELAIGVAGFPEGHPATPNRKLEMEFLKQKVDSGADYICTQLFFDNRDYIDFRERCRLAGIDIPVLAGVMPLTSRASYERIPSLALGSRYPAELINRIEMCVDDAEVERVGIEWAVEQARSLAAEGADGIHLYSLNQLKPVKAIWDALGG